MCVQYLSQYTHLSPKPSSLFILSLSTSTRAACRTTAHHSRFSSFVRLSEKPNYTKAEGVNAAGESSAADPPQLNGKAGQAIIWMAAKRLSGMVNTTQDIPTFICVQYSTLKRALRSQPAASACLAVQCVYCWLMKDKQETRTKFQPLIDR